jgi:multimeric flavodoxin WrbA
LSKREKLNERMRVVLIVTHSRRGFTDNMAKAIAEGVEEVPNVNAVIRRVNEVRPSDFVEADALAIGSPTYIGYFTGELKCLLDDLKYSLKMEKVNLQKKPAAAFVHGRFRGYKLRKLQFRSTVLKELERILFSSGMRKAAKGIYLATGIGSHDPRYKTTDPRPLLTLTPKQAVLCKNLGRKLALCARQQS